MQKTSHRLLATTAVAVVAVGVLVAFGAGKRAYQNGAYILPAAQIISWDTGIGMLDTRTGAIYRLEGNVDNPSTRVTWDLAVGAVQGETSGMLEIQHATFNDPGTIFLVDVQHGTTWVLRRRASTHGTWDRVHIYR